MTYLYPQLRHGIAQQIIRESILPFTPDEVLEQRKPSRSIHPSAIFSATGGVRVNDAQIDSLVESITICARNHGFPETATQANRLQFDYETISLLSSHMPISPSEASRGGVWNHLCCVSLPHVVRWRFPEDRSSRFVSGRRNTFERLWRRGLLLTDHKKQDQPFWILEKLNEDELVQLMERPQLHGRSDLALETASQFLALLDTCNPPRRELFRELQKRLRRLAAVVEFDSLTPSERSDTLGGVLSLTRHALSKEVPGASQRRGESIGVPQ